MRKKTVTQGFYDYISCDEELTKKYALSEVLFFLLNRIPSYTTNQCFKEMTEEFCKQYNLAHSTLLHYLSRINGASCVDTHLNNYQMQALIEILLNVEKNKAQKNKCIRHSLIHIQNVIKNILNILNTE